jgi:hypothetical protein
LRLVSDAPDIEELDTTAAAAAAEKAQCHVGCSFALRNILEEKGRPVLALKKRKA